MCWYKRKVTISSWDLFDKYSCSLNHLELYTFKNIILKSMYKRKSKVSAFDNI